MIEVNYNEYKETIAENMRLIRVNHDLKEIIKEAREYIESNPLVYVGDTDVKVEDILYQEKSIKETKFFKTLFEILERKNNE